MKPTTIEELAKILFRRKWKDRLWEDPCFITARGEATEDATAILQHLHDNPPVVMVEAMFKVSCPGVPVERLREIPGLWENYTGLAKAAFAAVLDEGKEGKSDD